VRGLTPADTRRLDDLFARHRAGELEHRPAAPTLEPLPGDRCHWCGLPAVRWIAGTCSNTTYHSDGTSTVVLWHVGCLGPP